MSSSLLRFNFYRPAEGSSELGLSALDYFGLEKKGLESFRGDRYQMYLKLHGVNKLRVGPFFVILLKFERFLLICLDPIQADVW